tara:strand:+ start:216 stop:377 length:162 start_codon:yes stop_codon:yes gene_type:complete
VVYPHEDRSYERYSRIRDLKEGLFGNVLGWLNRAEMPVGATAGEIDLKRIKAF